MSCGTPRASVTPIRVTRGTSKTLLFTVRADVATGEMSATITGLDQASVGNPVDLTGARVWFTVKNRLEDVAAAISKKNVIAGGVDNQVLVVFPQSGVTQGQVRVFVDVADTALLDPAEPLLCDLFVQRAGGPPIDRQQVMANRPFVVDPAVTTTF